MVIKKICHITTAHPPFDTRIFYKECLTLSKAGYEVSLIAQYHKQERIKGVKIIPLKKPKRKIDRRIITTINALIECLKVNAKLYHFHDPELIPIGILLKLLRKKVIYDIHEYFSEDIATRYNTFIKLRLFKFGLHMLLERLPSHVYDLLIFPTISLEKAIAGNSNSINLINFPNLSNNNKDLNNLKEKKQYDIIHVGTISPLRMAFMLRVAESIKNKRRYFKWLFLGISDETKKWVFKNTNHEFIKKHLIMIEKVPHKDVLYYINRSKIGFNYHPFTIQFNVSIPIKVFEYMLIGIPVVTTALPEMNRYLKNDFNAILIDSQDPKIYSEALLKLIEYPEYAIKIGMRGKDLIINKLNWENSEANKLVLEYKRILGEI